MLAQAIRQFFEETVTRALLLTLAFFSAAATAQVPCSQLPAAEREAARLAGHCTGSAPIVDVKPVPIEMAVPDVVGLDYDAARRLLIGYRVERNYRSSQTPGGTVLAQQPAAGTMLRSGSAVQITLSDGSEVSVPRVIGLNINEARQRLAERGSLKPQTVVTVSDLPPGIVISQQPAEGEPQRRGGVVTLSVSAGPAGPEMFEVPSVVGMPVDRAMARLGRFKVEQRVEPSSRPAGVVLQQAPPGGRVAPGTPITLTVSSGRWTEVYEMPDLVGRSADEAISSLAEFTVETTESISAEPRGHVLSQNPPPGAGIIPGSLVRLRLSNGALVRVPSVVDRTLAEARATVSELRGVRLVVSGPEHDGPIVSQQPSAGAEVPRGSDLHVTLSSPARSVAGRITGSGSNGGAGGGFGRGGAPTPAQWLLALVVLLLIATVAWSLRRRREFSSVTASWSAASHLERDPVAVSGAAPRGPEVTLRSRVERGSTAVHVDARR